MTAPGTNISFEEFNRIQRQMEDHQSTLQMVWSSEFPGIHGSFVVTPKMIEMCVPDVSPIRSRFLMVSMFSVCFWCLYIIYIYITIPICIYIIYFYIYSMDRFIASGHWVVWAILWGLNKWIANRTMIQWFASGWNIWRDCLKESQSTTTRKKWWNPSNLVDLFIIVQACRWICGISLQHSPNLEKPQTTLEYSWSNRL